MQTNATKSAQFNKIDSTAHIGKVPIKKYIADHSREKNGR
jgi:hypothetical protein